MRKVPPLRYSLTMVGFVTRTLLIGEAAPKGQPAFRGASGKRLAGLLGVTLDEMHAVLEAVNLLPSRPTRPVGTTGKGDPFPPDLARRKAASIELGGRRAILAGRRVAKAFGLPDSVPFLGEADLRGGRVLLLPHPSGIVLWWNDPRNVRRAARKLGRFVFKG